MRQLLALALAIALLGIACTADDPGPKKCEVGTSDPDLECVSGYFCDCKPDGCFCVPDNSAQGLRRGPLRRQDPNRLFLRRMGLIERR